MTAFLPLNALWQGEPQGGGEWWMLPSRRQKTPAKHVLSKPRVSEEATSSNRGVRGRWTAVRSSVPQIRWFDALGMSFLPSLGAFSCCSIPSSALGL